jgi:hypothetical protein
MRSGGDITSNGGIPLLSQVDQQMGLTRSVARVFNARKYIDSMLFYWHAEYS